MSRDQTIRNRWKKKHLPSVLVCNGYPFSLVQKITKTRIAQRREFVAELKSTPVLPHVQGASYSLLPGLKQQGICTTLRSELVRQKDTCECGKIYIGKTGRPMQERTKEHDRDIRLARTQTFTFPEQAEETVP